MAQLGDIQMRFVDGIKRRNQIYVECPICHKLRWVNLNEVRRSNYTGRCKPCNDSIRGSLHPNWKGGTKNNHGYICVKMPKHPRADNSGYVRQHILVWEKANNKTLPDGWVIHHLNGIRGDNRITNLVAMPSQKHRCFIPTLQKRIQELEAIIKHQGLLC